MNVVPGALSPPDPLVQELLTRHHEVIVICADLDSEGESTIAVFNKLYKNGRLSLVLLDILENLKSAWESKHRTGQAPSPTPRDQGDADQNPTHDNSGGEAAASPNSPT